MSHFYEVTSKHSAFFREDIRTAAQARKERLASGKKIVASVTEKLKVFPNRFIADWRVREALKIAKRFPDLEDTVILEMLWGTRQHPITGEEVGSADWGTECHTQLELAMNNKWEPNEWEPFVRPFIDWTNKSNLEVLATETIIASETPSFNTAGTIDLLARINGKVALLDYKTRKVPSDGDIRRRTRPSDAMQLASESNMVRAMMHLDYNPSIYTVIIDTETGDTYVHEWTDRAFEKALGNAISCFTFYDKVEGL
tara:strand:+ start:670 stop:1437 length:768 start_codon:yes stop_codon:yes gene_type:complete